MAKKTITTPRALKAALKASNAEIEALKKQIADRDAELAGFRQSAGRHDTEFSEMQGIVSLAKSALAPLVKKANWKDTEWPPLAVVLTGQITWGDLKAAIDAGKSICRQ